MFVLLFIIVLPIFILGLFLHLDKKKKNAKHSKEIKINKKEEKKLDLSKIHKENKEKEIKKKKCKVLDI